MREFKYQNNFAWPGITAILYKVSVERFCNLDTNYIKEEYFGLREVGFEWKKTSDNEWTTVNLSPNGSSYDYWYHFNWTNEDLGQNYKVHSYGSVKNKYCICPSIVVIKNLESNTSYDVRTYYMFNDVKTTYNEQTISTLDAEPFVFEFEEPTYDSSMDNIEINYENVENMLSNSLSQLKEIYSMFLHSLEGNEHYSIVVKSNMGFAAASIDTYNNIININYDFLNCEVNENNIRILVSILVHEMAHDKMKDDKHITGRVEQIYYDDEQSYLNKVIKFMEIVTSSPYACWQWKGSHNFPMISSEVYDFVENCIIAAACELSQECP